MGVMIGFFLGYVFGTRAGREGFEEMKEALLTIGASGELRELVGGGVSLVADVLRQGQSAVGGDRGSERSLRIA